MRATGVKLDCALCSTVRGGWAIVLGGSMGTDVVCVVEPAAAAAVTAEVIGELIQLFVDWRRAVARWST